MKIINKIKSVFERDSDAIATAKMLPVAYKEMLGVDFMECEDRTDPDAWGMGDAIALAEVKRADNETGNFEFYFVIQDKEDETMFDRFICKMNASIVENEIIFSSGIDKATATYPASSKGLQNILDLALRNRVQVPIK